MFPPHVTDGLKPPAVFRFETACTAPLGLSNTQIVFRRFGHLSANQLQRVGAGTSDSGRFAVDQDGFGTGDRGCNRSVRCEDSFSKRNMLIPSQELVFHHGNIVH